MRKRFLSVLMLLSIVASGVVGCKADDNKKNELPAYLSFDIEDISYLVKDGTDALTVIKDMSEEYGLKDFEINQEECQKSKTQDSISYSFSQTYKDIPVYGRKVLVRASENGQLMEMSNNYMSLNDVEMLEKVSEEEAREIVENAYNEEVYICNDGKTIYSLYGTPPTLAWQFYVNGAGVAEKCFVDASSGEILASFSDILVDKGMYEDENGAIYFNTKKIDNGTYLLIDEERNLSVYDSENQMTNYALVDDAGNVYYNNIDKGKWYDVRGNEVICTYKESTKKWNITDTEGYVLGENAEQVIYTENVFEPLEVISNDSTIWTNEIAAKAISLVGSTYDFFKTVLARSGYDGNNGRTNIYVNDGWDNGNNAYSYLGENRPPTVLAFGYDETITADLTGHEFMHSVERTISDMIYQNESGALKEALSDVFGELVEDWIIDGNLDDDCDWLHGSRNMARPSEENVEWCYYSRNGLECPVYKKNKKHIAGTEVVAPGMFKKGCCTVEIPYPDTYRSENYWTGSDDNGGCHVNCTIISHACYLMTHPVNGAGLTNEELAKVLYETLGSLVPDCDFNAFATAVRNNAVGLRFSDEKIQSIEDAFKQVGLKVEPALVVKIDESQLSNNTNYSWIVEPVIEADDIFYLPDYPNVDVSVNELSKQSDNPNAVIQQGEQFGIIDFNGELLTEVVYKEIANFGDNYMMIRTVPEYSEEYGRDWEIYWLNKDGEVRANVGNGVLDTIVYYYYEGNRQRVGYLYSDFVQETIPVQESSEYFGLYDIGTAINSLDGKYALEYECNLITDFIYDECGSLSEGLFAVCQNGKWGYVNEKGEVIIPLEYDASWYKYPIFDMGMSRSSNNVKDYCYAASDGYVVLCKDDQWEIRDTSGKLVISEGNFEAICPVFDGKCWVKKDGRWGVIKLETPEQEITDEMLRGIWLQKDSSDAMQFIFDAGGKVKYYTTASHEADYTTTYSLANSKLTISLINLDGSGVTQLEYDLNYSENELIKTLNITPSTKNNDVDVSKLYGWGNFISGTYIQINQEAVGVSLGVPDNMDVDIEQSESTYWHAGQMYTTYIIFEKDNGLIASATVNALTGELVKDILIYSGNSRTMTPKEICEIVAEHYNKENNTDEYVAFESECSETEEGYFLILRTQEGNEPNAWVYYVTVNLTTGEVVNDLGEKWFLY